MGKSDATDEAAGRGAVPFGERLRSMRRATGLSQEELASRAGLSPNAVSALERGARKRPQPHTVRSLSDALGLTEDERAAFLASVPERGGGHAPSADVGGISVASSAPVFALPRPAAPLVGREQEVGEVSRLLGRPEVRLLTLTGIGGVGKTRLAAEAAREASSLFPDGAVFVGLAPLSDPSLVLPTVSRSLGLPEAEGRAPMEALVGQLADKNLLLVLDNLEHLLEAAPEVAALLEGCPGLTVLATSRAPLRIRGEHEYPVPPLGLPASTRSPAEEDVLASPAGTLFAERARAASPGFAITRENASAVAAICWRLAGIPLALELAAAKARFLDPAALLARLDRALSSAWARDLPKRQRTMRATLDWSRDLLSEPERELFRRLSAFSGGFSLEAAEAVGTAAAGSDAVEDVLDLLGTLVEQSLVVAEHGSGGDEPRYGMLEPVRQYAVEKLKESGKAEETRRRHAAFFLYLAERAVPELRGPRQGVWLNRLEAEHGNLQVAIGLLRDRHDTEMVARLGWALWLFWYLRGHSGEGLHWMEEVLSSEDAPALARARASCVAGIMLFRRGAGEPASARLEEALALFQSLGDTAGAMVAAHFAGLMALGSGDTELAEGLLEEGLRLCRSLEDAWSEAIILANLGLIPLVRGDYELAEGYFQQALSLGRTTGNPLVKLPPLYQLAQVAQVQNDHRLAAERYGEALALGVEMQDVEEMGLCLRGLAECAVAEGDHARAGRLYGASDATLESTGAAFRAPQFSPSFHERYLVRARGELGDQTWSDTLEEGRRMPLEEAIGYAFEDKSGTA